MLLRLNKDWLVLRVQTKDSLYAKIDFEASPSTRLLHIEDDEIDIKVCISSKEHKTGFGSLEPSTEGCRENPRNLDVIKHASKSMCSMMTQHIFHDYGI